MIVRVLAALVGLAVLLPALIWGGTLAVEIIVPLVVLICLDEYARMAFPERHRPALAVLVVGSALLYLPALYLGDRYVLPGLALLVVLVLVAVLFRPGLQLERAADEVGRHLVGVGWVTGLFIFFPLLRRLDDGLVWIFLVLAIAWLGDTGGYFAGRAFGRRKLYPLVSPKKTWEGLAGGIILTILGVFVVRALALPELTAVDAVVIGGLLGCAGVVGDLSESMLKRAFQVKDSGWIMPGHGGLLDRVDSVMFVAPLLYGYAVLVKGY